MIRKLWLQVLLMSTGVIGRRMRIDALTGAVPELARTLERSPEAGLHAAVAITTTDLVSKTAALEVRAQNTQQAAQTLGQAMRGRLLACSYHPSLTC